MPRAARPDADVASALLLQSGDSERQGRLNNVVAIKSNVGEFGPEQVRAMRGSMSRADFARKVGVTPLTVYRWELPEDAAESRRPRGAVAERLRRVIAGEDELASTGVRRSFTRGIGVVDEDADIGEDGVYAELDADDAAAVLPALDRVLRAEYARAEADLMTLIVSNTLRSAPGRALAQAALALGQMLSRHDARGAFATIQPALKYADRGMLPPAVEIVVRTAAASAFAAPDGHLFSPGRVNAQVARVDQIATADTSPDILFILRGAAAASVLSVGLGGSDAVRRAREAVAHLLDAVTEPATRVMADELRVHFAMSGGQSAHLTRRFEEVAERAAQLGMPFVEARALAFGAIRMTDEVTDPQRILDTATKSKAIAARGRLTPGLHTLFACRAAAEAYLRMARFEDAERELVEGAMAAQQMGWSPVPLGSAFIRLYEYTGHRERIVRIAESLASFEKPIPRAVGEVLLAASAAVDGDKSDRLTRAELALEKAEATPFLIQEVGIYAVMARLPHHDVAEVKLALRRAQRMLDRLPSVALSASLKRHQALLACREGLLVEAIPLLEASIGTFTMVGNIPEAALGRYWLAKVKHALGLEGASALVEASARELAALGLAVHPPSMAFGEIDGASVAPDNAQPRTDGTLAAVERLTVRGLAPALVRTELVTIVRSMFPNRAVGLDEIADGATAATDAEAGFEFGDGQGRRLHLRVGGPLPDGAYELLRVLTAVTSLSLEVGALRGLSEDAQTRLEEDDDPIEVRGLVASSPAMRRLRGEIARLGSSRATVIIEGESGTGKEVIARAIHELSTRAEHPYVTFNCAAVPRELFEGQLFGYRRGAFTGAHGDHPGVIRSANGGTLFLDEIGELPLDMQAKLLRFLENREILPLGETRPIEVDVRTIAATHQDLAQRVRDGKFREDLYYRLQVVPVFIPPLRDRPEDVVALARHFVRTMAPEGHEPPVLAPDALSRLVSHHWPGNVRELRNVIERILAFAPLPRVITASHLRLGESTRPSSPRR